MIKWVSDNVGYTEGAVNLGVILDSSNYIVDTGLDNTSINKLKKDFSGEIEYALITHHHADHIGGLSKLTILDSNVKIVCNEIEIPFIENTLLEPLSITGFYPHKKLRNKHLMAKSVSLKTRLSLPPNSIEVIHTPGHTLGHQVYKYEDIIFVGDAAFKESTLSKYKILFASNPLEAINSVDLLLKTKGNRFVLAHGGLEEDQEFLKVTKEHFISTFEIIESLIKPSIRQYDLVDLIFKELDLKESIKSRGITQYYLLQHTIKGYISGLVERGTIVQSVNDSGELVVNIN